MSELSDLYQEVILDHSKAPRNFGALEDANRSAKGHNPLCGDKITVYVKLDGDTITDVHFDGSGCAISKASASMMTQAVKGKTKAEAQALLAVIGFFLTGDAPLLLAGLVLFVFLLGSHRPAVFLKTVE